MTARVVVSVLIGWAENAGSKMLLTSCRVASATTMSLSCNHVDMQKSGHLLFLDLTLQAKPISFIGPLTKITSS